MQDTAAHCGSKWPISICSCRLCLSVSCLVSCLQINNQDTTLLTRTICTINTTTCIFRHLTCQWQAHIHYYDSNLVATCSCVWNFPRNLLRGNAHIQFSLLNNDEPLPCDKAKHLTSPWSAAWLTRQSGSRPRSRVRERLCNAHCFERGANFLDLAWADTRHSDTRSRPPELRRSTSHYNTASRFTKISQSRRRPSLNVKAITKDTIKN